MIRLGGAALAAGAVLLAGSLAGCGQDAAPEAGDGGFVPGHPSQRVSGSRVTALIPTGRVSVTVGKPVDHVTAEEARDADAHDPPSGEHYLPITWTFDGLSMTGDRAVMARRPQGARLSLVADGHRVPVAPLYQVVSAGSGVTDTGLDSGYLPVPASASKLEIAVSYDGLTQTVDVSDGTRDAGVAAALYHPRHLPAPRCDAGRWSGAAAVDLSCRFGSVTELPYLPGRGWVAAGHTWLVVPFAAYWGAARVAGRSYDVGPVRATATLDGRRAVGTGLFGPRATDVGRAADTFVFNSPRSDAAGTVRVLLRAGLTSRTAELTHRRAVVRRSFPLG